MGGGGHPPPLRGGEKSPKGRGGWQAPPEALAFLRLPPPPPLELEVGAVREVDVDELLETKNTFNVLRVNTRYKTKGGGTPRGVRAASYP